MTRIKQNGFTILELLLVIVVIGLLAVLVLTTYTGIQRNQRNQERRRDIQDLYQQLEAYNVENGRYPTFNNVNDTNWRATYMKTIDKESLRDPSNSSYLLVTKPAVATYSYDVVAADGSTCDNKTKNCVHYTLTATLEGSAQGTFVKSSLN